ncbi:MAG: transporter ATP-binding protein [Candidatus Taylorbacteria bacterium]|nr:transporter ATP-binding protein [Candidatus Taylorbacteria bacterium]
MLHAIRLMKISLDSARHTKPLGFYLKVNRQDLGWFFGNASLYALGQVIMLTATYMLGRTIDALSNDPTHAKFFAWMFIACVVGHEVSWRFGHMCEMQILGRIRRNSQKALFDHTTSLSFGYFADRFAGEIAHKISSIADNFERMNIIMTNGFIEDSVLIPLTAIALGMIHWYYGAFVIVWGIVMIFGSRFLAKEMNRRSEKLATEEAKTIGTIVDVYGNIGTVKVYGKAGDANRAHLQIDAERRAYARFGWWDVVMFHFQGWSIIILCSGLVLITSILHGQHAITVGQIVFVSTAGLRLFSMSWEMARNIADFIRYRGECSQNLADLVVAPAIIDGNHAQAQGKEAIIVHYDHIAFGYVEERPILDDFSITIKPGEKVGIVGLSGAGKTTFANLLLRFFDPQSGTIRFNGTDIRNFTQEFLRSHISYISQDTSLFHATISENIAYGSSAASEENIETAARLAYADDFIMKLPHGYKSIVGERGVKLSGGQRQRIAIARALLADRPIFLLDEATSALDSDSEGKIQKGLSILMENKTVIAIAHRLSTLSHMDRIIFLENGKIAEDGTHEQLLAQKGRYAALWQMQAGGFLPA